MPILLARVIDEGCLIAPVLVFLATITASSLGCSHWQPPELISAQPAAQIVYELQVATFRVTANAGATVKYQWQRNGNDIPGATSSVYTTPRTTIADNGMEFRAVVSTPHASETSNSATLTVNQGIDVPTYQYDNMRTGRDASEMVLTPTSISQSGFGKITSFVVDGRVDAQPLYMSNISIAGVGPRNVLYVATEHGTVFAFDADATGAQG